MTALLWLCVALNLASFVYGVHYRRGLKRARGNDAAMLSAAADMVRHAGRGDYIDGHHAEMLATALDGQAERALILGGYRDRELWAWYRDLRRQADGESPTN